MPHHHHDHNCHSCAHEAVDVDHALEMGIQYSLFEKIDMPNLECLNEETEGSGRLIFKAYAQRCDFERFVSSDADEELLFNIPFTGNIKLKGIIIVGAEDETHPSKMRLFKNIPKMTFDQTSTKPDQEFELHQDNRGEIEYATKVVTFSSVHHLSIHFPANFGGDKTRIYYIGLRGEFTDGHYHGVTICSYEAAPNLSDHKNNVMDNVKHQIQ